MTAAAIGLGWLSCQTLPAYAADQAVVPAHGRAPDRAELSPRTSRIRDLVPDWRHRCLAIGDEVAGTSEQQALQTAINQLQRSELGSWLIDQAADRSVMICLDSSTDLEAYYRAHLHLVGLNARLGPAGRLVFLAHELAHVPQHPRFSNNRRFSPEDMLLLQRVREAAAEAVATRALWQLRNVGIGSPWLAKLETAYGDIARVFETSMDDGTGEAAELWATRTAFHHWFEAAWRLDIYDDLMLTTIARIAVDHIGMLPSSRRLSDSYLRDISSYAGQRFLIGGDGRLLMGAFGTSWQVSRHQARLDAILGRAQFGLAGAKEQIPMIEGTGLSASSSGPIRLGAED